MMLAASLEWAGRGRYWLMFLTGKLLSQVKGGKNVEE